MKRSRRAEPLACVTQKQTRRSEMMRWILGVLAAVLLHSHLAFASEPHLFVLRRELDRSQGIVRFDPELRSAQPFADFFYDGGLIGPYGGLQLAAVADRVIAQGAAYYDFDAGTGQLLRRYPALEPAYDSWAFHGAAVDRETALRLGIEPGFYGSVVCPPGPGVNGEGCEVPSVPFPGYATRSNLSEQRVFLRRGFEPDDPELSLVKLFSADAAGGNPWSKRLTALDAERQQFSFWLEGSVDGGNSYLERLTAAPIVAGGVGEEVIVREEVVPNAGAPERLRTARAFTFDPARDSFFLSFLHPLVGHEQRLLLFRRDGTEELLWRVLDGHGFDGIASMTATPPQTYTQLLPGIADAPGANGTYWRSDVWFFNPSGEPIEATLRRVTGGPATRLSVGPKSSLKLTNVLRELGGGPAGDGSNLDALIIESPYRTGEQLSVYSRTYTPEPSGGSYGQAIPAVPSRVGFSNHLAPTTRSFSLSDTHSVFILDKREPEQFRHNIGFVNTSAVPLEVRLRYGVVSGNPVDDPSIERFLTVPPHAVRQYAIEGLFPQEVLESRPPVIWVSGNRPAAVWLSMVDNRTGDATYIPFTLYGVEAGSSARLSVPAVAYTPGANGTFWRTDGYGIFSNHVSGGPPQSPKAEFHPAGGACGAGPQSLSLVPSPGVKNLPDFWTQVWYTTFADLARQACPGATDVRGALEVGTGSWTSMVTRTYTTREDGGTFGEMLPLYPPRGWPTRHFAGVEVNDAARVNVGLYNGSATPTRSALRLYDIDGTLTAEQGVSLAPRESKQMALNEILNVELPAGTYGLSVVTVEGVGSWPYVSTVDNRTGDPTNWW
jgi:hypothetical protein